MGTGSTPRTPALPTPVRTTLWLVAYVLASLLGRIVVLDPGSVVVVWPASGVALVWLASAATRRQLVVDSVLLGASTAAVIALTGGSLTYSLISVVAVGLALVPVLLMRRWIPEVWGAGGERQLARLGEFGLLVAAIAIGSLAVTLVRMPLDLLTGPIDVRAAVDRFTRHLASMTSLGVLGLMVGGWLAERRAGTARPLDRALVRRTVLEVLAIEAFSAVLLTLFWRRPDLPMTFVLTLTVVWAALRLSRLLTAAHATLVGVLTVTLTLYGLGPLARVASTMDRALMAQVFVTVAMVTGMTISLIRVQVVETIARLERSEAELRARGALQDLLLANLGDGVAIVEEGGRYIMSNGSLREIMTGQRHGTAFTGVVPAASTYHLHHPDGRPLETHEYPYLRAIDGEAVHAQTVHVRRPPATSEQVIEISAVPLPTEPDQKKRAMVVVRDVTVAATHRESLVAFAGTVAHDLKNPLSVIDGWAEALQEDLSESQDPDTAMALPMVQHIRSSVDQMRALIADLLAHAVARDQVLQCEHVPVQNLVKHVVNSRDVAATGGEVVTGADVDVWADRVLLRQVLDNLIGNALKYVAPGQTPRVVVDTEPAGPGWARILVRDNGIGIPARERERVFDRFTRLTAENYSGTGLGLAICKRIVERHGGHIEAVDNPDRVGACFAFTMPLTSEAMATAGQRPAPA